MRKLMLMAAGLAAITITGIAAGKALNGAQSARSVVGTFTATSVADSQTRTCTTADGKTIATTKARYSGTAAGDADLAGPITLEARAVINTTDGFGVVEGRLRIDVASGGDTVARFTGVYDHGRLAGLATGRVRDPDAKLIANLSAGFSAGGGFTDGKFGATAGGSAVELGPGRCTPTRDEDDKDDETNEARGTVSAVSSTSITVAGVTCAVPQSLAAKVTQTIRVGDRAEIRCAQVGGQTTLVKVKSKTRRDSRDDD